MRKRRFRSKSAIEMRSRFGLGQLRRVHNKSLKQPEGKSTLPIVAIILSTFSAIFSVVNFQENSTSSAIWQQYASFEELTKLPLTNPGVAHLIAMPNSYAITSCEVAVAYAHASQQELAAHRLKERFIANYIFTLFEAALYEHGRASLPLINGEKRKFNEEVLGYFTTRVLRNPRLLWYWDEKGGQLSEHYEISTRQYYNDHVLGDDKSSFTEVTDPLGPFGIRGPQPATCKLDTISKASPKTIP